MGKKLNISVIFSVILLSALNIRGERYVGGDISLLPHYEEAGAKYYDHEGRPIADLIPFLKEEGMNAMRIRVFVNPENYTGSNADHNACQTIESVIPLCKRIKDAGMELMLDFHYSDTWADPAQQFTPKDWADLTDKELIDRIYHYTKESLETLKDNDIIPDFIQPGNEISFGMLWGGETTPDEDKKKTFKGSDANWERLGSLLSNAIRACREVTPHAAIVLHTERTADIPVQNNFYEKMRSMNIDYDIIGLSYYPYFHGPLSSLDAAITSLEKNFSDKKIMIVETGYSYKWEVPGTSTKVDYPYSEEGQKSFTADLVSMLLRHSSVEGLFWWWLEYNAYGTNLLNWYNAPLFDSTSGKALAALKVLCRFAADDSGIVNIKSESPEEVFFDLSGRKIAPGSPGFKITSKGRKLMGER